MFREILRYFQAASKICFLLDIDRHQVWVSRMNCKHRGSFFFFFSWCSSALITEAKWHCTWNVQQTTAGRVVLRLFGSFRNLRIQGRKNALTFSPLTKCWSQWPLGLDAAQGLRKILWCTVFFQGKHCRYKSPRIPERNTRVTARDWVRLLGNYFMNNFVVWKICTLLWGFL